MAARSATRDNQQYAQAPITTARGVAPTPGGAAAAEYRPVGRHKYRTTGIRERSAATVKGWRNVRVSESHTPRRMASSFNGVVQMVCNNSERRPSAKNSVDCHAKRARIPKANPPIASCSAG